MQQKFPDQRQRPKAIWCLLFGGLLWVLWCAPPSVVFAVEMRVAAKIKVNRVIVGASSTAKLLDHRGRSLGTIPGRKPLVARVKGGLVHLNKKRAKAIWIDPGKQQFVYIGRRWYRGRTLLIVEGSKITAVNHVDLEWYLYSVVGGEMSAGSPMEALKAQAIAARTYALRKREHAVRDKKRYDLGATARWQVYKGVVREAPRTRKAVKETKGQVLVYGGKLILAAYHDTSGGHTEDVEHVWTKKKLAYLRGVPDFDQKSKSYRWTKKLTQAEAEKKLKWHLKGLGRLRGFQITGISPRGYVKSIKLLGTRGSKTLKGNKFKYALKLKSTRFSAKIKKGANSSAVFEFQGKELARRGYSCYQILRYYYQKTKFAKVK